MSTVQTQPAQTERNQDPYPDFNFTVHEYLNSQSRASQQSALRQGCNIIKSVFYGDTGWKSPKVDPTGARVKTSNIYVFNMAPPILPLTEVISRELKEWGTEVTEDEVYTLDTLDEFKSSDLRHTFRADPSTSFSKVEAKRTRAETSLVVPEAKEKRLKIGSLFRVIPQPHLHPTPNDLYKRSVGRPYTRCKPTYIAPYTVETYPKETRVGWLIPLRGSIPWDDCTSGEFLDTSVAVPYSAQPGTKHHISWTEGSIVSFWYYLLRLRKCGSLGRLAISFHASRDQRHVPETSNPASKATETSNVRHSPRALSTVDFIKVYHDALDALHVRNALDLFQYQYTQEDGISRKIRVLKGSRLVLVDELSQGIQVL